MTATAIALAALVVSVLSFILSFAQVIIQRIHNKKTVKPLGQIDLGDFTEKMYIYVVNNGTGPLIIKALRFHKRKDKHVYHDIIQCLDLNPKVYDHVSINSNVSKAVMPGKHFVIAEMIYTNQNDAFKVDLRKKLAELRIAVDYTDIYDKKYTIERDLNWFARHVKSE